MMNPLQNILYYGCEYVELAMDSMEHMINWLWLEISRIFYDICIHFFNNSVVDIVDKMSTLHMHIRGTDCIQSFSLLILSTILQG